MASETFTQWHARENRLPDDSILLLVFGQEQSFLLDGEGRLTEEGRRKVESGLAELARASGHTVITALDPPGMMIANGDTPRVNQWIDETFAAWSRERPAPGGSGRSREPMFGHHHRRFLARLDRARLEEAIRRIDHGSGPRRRAAESPRKSCEGCGADGKASRDACHSRPKWSPDPRGPRAARVPRLGRPGIHERVGGEFWKQVAELVSKGFHGGDFTAGLLAGIEQLAAHFPAAPGSAVNTLPDSVVEE